MMRVLFAAAEAYPLIKTGGLGDVAGALPLSLNRLGAEVRLLLPGYGEVMNAVERVETVRDLGPVLAGRHARLLSAAMPHSGLPLLIVDCPELYRRPGSAYQTEAGVDWPDNHLRFGLLARAAALAAGEGVGGWRPDIVHANDWHTGLLPYYLKRQAASGTTDSATMAATRTLFTIHNMAYQGVFGAGVMNDLALAAADLSPAGFEFWGNVSFLKAGLVFSDRISTVSPTYAQEIQHAPLGAGLEGVLAARQGDLSGITNGVDDAVWNPERDAFIVHQYSAATLDEKAKNRSALRQAMRLPEGETTLLAGVVSRLVEQKGIDLIVAALPQLAAAGVQLAVLGQGDAVLERALIDAARAHPGALAVRIGYDEALAHRIIAGCDFLLMPSRFEPCGLAQLYAQRYGTLPVVRRTGGLADTVHDGVDGFSFDEATPQALTAAVQHAAALFRRGAEWRALQQRAMARDVTWDGCARGYMDLYQDMLSAAHLP